MLRKKVSIMYNTKYGGKYMIVGVCVKKKLDCKTVYQNGNSI